MSNFVGANGTEDRVGGQRQHACGTADGISGVTLSGAGAAEPDAEAAGEVTLGGSD